MNMPLVVKLGGSHARSPLLRQWLRVVSSAAGAIVLVPGGGPFADIVRQIQPLMGFDERAAHEMALLAMTQYGRALVSLAPRLVMAASLEAIRAAWDAALVPVWSPWPMAVDAPDIPASWDAPRLLLIKHRDAPACARCEPLVADRLLDRGFPRFLSLYRGEVRIAGPADLPRAGIDPAALPGQRVLS
jgi:hypothetical protein